MSTLSKIFPAATVPEQSLEYWIEQVDDLHRTSCELIQLLFNLEQQDVAITNLASIEMALPTVACADICSLTGLAEIQLSQEGLGTMLKEALVKFKNFLIKLKDMVIAFFKRMFDTNIRVRKTLNGSISDFYQKQPSITEARLAQLRIYLPSREDVEIILPLLEDLANQTIEASKELTTEATLAAPHTALDVLGYNVTEEALIFETTSIKKINAKSKRLEELGWNIKTLIEKTNSLVTLCRLTEKANIIKNKLQLQLSAGEREVDRLCALADSSIVLKAQADLNDLSKRSGYIFKSTVILQSYVTGLSVLFQDTWQNINNL